MVSTAAKFLMQRPLLWPLLAFYVLAVPQLSSGALFSQWALVVLLSGALALKRFDWQRANLERGRDRQLSILAILTLCAIVIGALAMVDLTEFRISRDVDRASSIWYEVIDLHLISAWIAAVVLFAPERKPVMILGICLFALGLSLLVAILEGRRTSIVLPLVFLLYNLFIGGRLKARTIVIALALGALLPVLFLLVSSFRGVGVGDDYLTALSFRFFWPGIILERVLVEAHAFDPEIISQIASRFMEAVSGAPYFSRTIQFGHSLGLTDPTNFAVGINYGVIAELFLAGGFLAVLVGLFFLNTTTYLCFRLCESAPFGLGLIVPVVYLQGFQMEYAYTITATIKLTALILLIICIRSLVYVSTRRRDKGASLSDQPDQNSGRATM